MRTVRLLPCADVGLLVELEDLDAVLALHAELSVHPLPGMVDLVPTARTLLLSLDPRAGTVADTARAVAQLRPQSEARADAGEVQIPVTYDGPDLAEVGKLTGLGDRGVISAHTEQLWTVAFAGFAPGFGYLAGEDDRLHVPRREDPRTRVPAGSVGLAGEFSGIYPRESPGGWQLIGQDDRLNVPRRDNPRTKVPAGSVGLAGEFSGVYPRESPGGWQLLGRTEVAMWDLERNPPALLHPGVRVRFVDLG